MQTDSKTKTDSKTIRETVEFYLEKDRSIVGVAIDAVILLLIFLFSSSFVIETYRLPTGLRYWIDWGNQIILYIFSIEYVLRVWSAENRLRYIFSLFSIIDLLAIVPFWFGIMDGRFIRIFRWFRVLRVVRFLERDQRLIPSIPPNGILFIRTLFTLFAIVFIYSGFIYQVEHTVNSQQFKTFLDSFYFSVVTMTTVGYGDIAPISEAGRLFTVLMIFTGVALVPWQVGELLRRIVSPSTLQESHCHQCNLEIHDSDALFCKRCGSQL